MCANLTADSKRRNLQLLLDAANQMNGDTSSSSFTSNVNKTDPYTAHNSSIRSKSSARRSLNFSTEAAARQSATRVRDGHYSVVRSKMKTGRCMPLRAGSSNRFERTWNWVSQHCHMQNRQLLPQNDSSFASGKSSSSARRTLQFDHVSRRSYHEPSANGRIAIETTQRCEAKSSVLDYVSRPIQDIIMDHPYAKKPEILPCVKDVGTSPIHFIPQQSGKMSGIQTLKSTNDSRVDSKALSSRYFFQSGKMSGIHTLGSSFSNEDNARNTSQNSDVRNDAGKRSRKQLVERDEVIYDCIDRGIDVHARLTHSFNSSGVMLHHIHTPGPATREVKKSDHITERLDATTMFYRNHEFVSPTFSKVVTSTPQPRCYNNDDLSRKISFDEPIKVAEPGEMDVSTVHIGSTEAKELINGSISRSPRCLDNPESNVSSDDDSVGKLDFLNDLTIFEYFGKFDDISNDGSVLFEKDPLSSSNANLPVVESCAEGHCIDVLDKEALQVKKKKSNARKVNKKRKERGLSYIRKDGTIVPEREIKSPCDCKLKCYEKYPDTIRRKFLTNLLRLKIDSQNQFLANHIMVKKTARPQVVNSRRCYTRVYKLPGVNGTVKVCKTMFQATYDIGSRKMRTLAARIVAGSGVPADDERQRNCSRQTVSQEHLSYIKQHILSFPAYSSHYTREKSSRLYLSSDLSIRRMYELYQNKCSVDSFVLVHYNTYRLIFKSFNLSFRAPKTDTCGKCDRLRMQVKTETNDTVKEELRTLLDIHQEAAQRVYDEKRNDVNLSETDSTVRTCFFDLQKQLATPHLRNGEAFYSRQLYTYNMTVFTSFLGENSASCYLWDETKGKRGSQEIGSCLLQDLRRIPNTVETVIYYSDRCSGQNNNKTIIFLFTYFIELMKHTGRKLQIIHKFMHSGHSHMEVDTVHAAIEKAKKKTTVDIEIPHDWAIFISSIRRAVPFDVVELEQKEILNLKSLETRYQIPKKSISGEPFRMKSAMVFRYSTEHPELVEYKADVMDVKFSTIQVFQRTADDVTNLLLEPITDQPIELPTAKLDDLRKLMPYIKQKEYYSTFLKKLVPPKKGRKAKNTVVDHFEADRDPLEDTDEE